MISIITSLYKSDKYLDKYLKRVFKFAKNLKSLNINFEILAIANDPSDYEKRKINSFSKANSFFKVYEVPRESLYATWNRGVGLAKYELIGFWHVDDVRFPKAIKEAIDIFEQGADFIHSPYIYQRNISIAGLSIPIKFLFCDNPVYNEKLFTTGMPFGPFFMFTKKLYELVGPFDEQFKICGDFDWTIRAAKKTKNFGKTKSWGGIFFNEGKSLSGSSDERHLAENNVVFSRHEILNKIKNHSQLEDKYKIDKILYRDKYISY